VTPKSAHPLSMTANAIRKRAQRAAKKAAATTTTTLNQTKWPLPKKN